MAEDKERESHSFEEVFGEQFNEGAWGSPINEALKEAVRQQVEHNKECTESHNMDEYLRGISVGCAIITFHLAPTPIQQLFEIMYGEYCIVELASSCFGMMQRELERFQKES